MINIAYIILLATSFTCCRKCFGLGLGLTLTLTLILCSLRQVSRVVVNVLEKACDRIPSYSILGYIRKKGVPEQYVTIKQDYVK